MVLDVEIHHLEKKTELEFSNIEVVTEGPLRAIVATEVKYGKSKIRVNVCAFSYEFSVVLIEYLRRSPLMLSEVRHPLFACMPLLTLALATVKESSRSSIRFDAHVDWRERHEFLKCERTFDCG
jgi:alpha-mannosidase